MKLGISLTWDPSYSRHMHAYKEKVYKCNVIGLKYDQRPLAFINKLLLLRNFFKVRLLRTLELRIVYRSTHIHTSKQVQIIRNSTPINIKRTK
jgi:hypothetical protein